MGSDRSRAVVLAVAYTVLIVLATFVMAWFVIEIAGLMRIEVGLRNATVCQQRQCLEFVIPREGRNAFGILGAISFWGSLALILVVAYQAYQAHAGGAALASVSRKGMLLGGALLISGLLAGFVFAPDLGSVPTQSGALEIKRTLAPLLYVVGHLLGMASLHFAARDRRDDLPAVSGPYVPAAVARERLPTPGASAPLADRPASERTRRASEVPANLRKRLSYVVLSGEVTAGGIDARREDGSSLLVMWRDVVGLVVRRLPDELEGATFLDLVSVNGATLRVLPWSRLTGASVEAEGEARVRALIAYIQAAAPDARIDGATKTFLAGEPAAQLKDPAMLATHDERLA